MKSKRDGKSSGRRDFLKMAGLGSLAGAAAAVAGTKEATAAEADHAEGDGYRETAHVKKVYELSRF